MWKWSKVKWKKLDSQNDLGFDFLDLWVLWKDKSNQYSHNYLCETSQMHILRPLFPMCHAHVSMLKLRIWVTHQILNFETRVLQYLQIVEHWNVNITYLYIEDSMWKNNMRLIFFNQVRLHSYIYYNQYHKYLPALEWVAVFHQSTYGPRLPK